MALVSSREAADWVWRTENGTLRACEPAPGVVHIRYQGTIGPEFAPAITNWMRERAAERGRIADCFVDTRGIKKHDPKFREKLTEGMEEMRESIGEIHMYFESKLIQMTVSVMQMVTRKQMTSYRTAGQFEAALAAATQRAQR
jgi:hypothetical protein